MPAAEPESRPSPDLSISKEYHPSTKDLEFEGRSRKGEKFFFKEFGRDLGGTLKTSFWGWGALGFAGGIGLTAALLPVDDPLNDAWTENSLFGETGNDVLGWVFNPVVYGGVSLFTWIAAGNTDHPKLALTSRTVFEALLISMAITFVGKAAFRRERPDGGNFSFPSGHTTAAFSTAAVLTVFYGWKGALPSYAVATVVALNRLDDKSHFLTDVVMGAVIGTVVGVGAARFQKKDKPNYFLTPQVSRDRTTLSFTYIF